jgi:hypothetical protein
MWPSTVDQDQGLPCHILNTLHGPMCLKPMDHNAQSAFFMLVYGFGIKISCLEVKCSDTWAMPQALYGIFRDRVYTLCLCFFQSWFCNPCLPSNWDFRCAPMPALPSPCYAATLHCFLPQLCTLASCILCSSVCFFWAILEFSLHSDRSAQSWASRGLSCLTR